jgi:hypothetical protein
MMKEMDMTCVAKIMVKHTAKNGYTWGRTWQLFDGNRAFGIVTWNDYWKANKFQVSFYSPLGEDFGYNGFKDFDNINDALAYAKEHKDENIKYTLEMVDETIARLKKARYGDEMSDDFFYSNGKGREYDRKERILKQLRARVSND